MAYDRDPAGQTHRGAFFRCFLASFLLVLVAAGACVYFNAVDRQLFETALLENVDYAALGMDAVLLTPGCSDPLYRRAARVSMGTVFQVPWTFFDRQQCPWPEKGMEVLRELGFKTAAMALKKDSVSIGDPALLAEERLAVVLGTEGDGLAAETIADCDYTVMIPMAHGVDSLNVAAASAVAFWELGKR